VLDLSKVDADGDYEISVDQLFNYYSVEGGVRNIQAAASTLCFEN
jgi:hypothetical protein